MPSEPRACAAAQFERTFAAQRLGNWEIADTAKLESATLRNRFDQTAPRTSATKFIAGDNGYLHPHHKKAGVTAFTTTDAVQRPVYAVSKPRWPEVCTLPNALLMWVSPRISNGHHVHTRIAALLAVPATLCRILMRRALDI